MQRSIIFSLILTLSSICSSAMDFGLRFNSHAVPLEKRTSLVLSEDPFPFNNNFKIGFHFNFYAQPLFGTLISVNTNDGNSISIVASHQEQDAYMLGLVVNDRIKLMPGLISVNPDKEDKIDLTLDKKRGAAIFNLNNNEIELPLDMSKVKSASATFGINMDKGVTDVAPMEVRNIRVFIDNQNTHFWDLKYHDSPTTRIDEISGLEAIATNPHWLIDDHTDWHLIYKETVKNERQTAFDPISETFFIVDNEKIKVWSPLSSDSTEYAVTAGFRPMAFSNHLIHSPRSGNLINYNLSKRIMSTLNPAAGVWSSVANVSPGQEANYANHAFAMTDSVAYAFGGYGFYKFHNDLFKINLITGAIEECKLQPEMMPMTSAAAAIVGKKLYIFGGKGNPSGRQELPSKCNYAMYAYDTETMKGELVWEIDSMKYEWLPSQTMYYDPLEDCFYAASTCHGGELVKISRTHPEINSISTTINSKMEYHDIVFDLFRSNDGKRYYLLIDKRIDAYTHDYSIYTISAPFLENPDVIKNKSLPSVSEDGFSLPIWIFIIIGVIIVGAITIFLVVRTNRSKQSRNVASANEIAGSPAPISPAPISPASTPQAPDEPTTDNAPAEPQNQESDLKEYDLNSEDNDDSAADVDDSPLIFNKHDDSAITSKFDRSKASISLLGAFCVRDKNGEDITTKFTDRLKSLLILLLLANSKHESGIKYQTIDEQIWGDKDEKSAQNNRNVYMRKLRLLLEEVGDVAITYEKGFFKINCDNIVYDYGEALKRINSINTGGNASAELINETLDLLLMGPLLPMTTYEWLDQYKADYSDRALEILNRLLQYEFSRNVTLSIKIAQTISCHEPLSEEAMKAKVILLNRKKKVGQAKKVYEKFCKEYSLSLGEEYPLSFPEICKSSILPSAE